MEEGQTAPDFRLALAGGGFRTLDELLAEGPVLLAFYKVTCPTCQLTLPYLERLQGGALRVFAVCQDDAGRAREFADAFEVELPNLLDSVDDGYPASNAYGVTHVLRCIWWRWTSGFRGSGRGSTRKWSSWAGRATYSRPRMKQNEAGLRSRN